MKDEILYYECVICKYSITEAEHERMTFEGCPRCDNTVIDTYRPVHKERHD